MRVKSLSGHSSIHHTVLFTFYTLPRFSHWLVLGLLWIQTFQAMGLCDQFSLLQATMLSSLPCPVGSRKIRLKEKVESHIAKHVSLWILNKAIRVWWRRAESSSWGHLSKTSQMSALQLCPLGLEQANPSPIITPPKRGLKLQYEQKPEELDNTILPAEQIWDSPSHVIFSNLSVINPFVVLFWEEMVVHQLVCNYYCLNVAFATKLIALTMFNWRDVVDVY